MFLDFKKSKLFFSRECRPICVLAYSLVGSILWLNSVVCPISFQVYNVDLADCPWFFATHPIFLKVFSKIWICWSYFEHLGIVVHEILFAGGLTHCFERICHLNFCSKGVWCYFSVERLDIMEIAECDLRAKKVSELHLAQMHSYRWWILIIVSMGNCFATFQGIQQCFP